MELYLADGGHRPFSPLSMLLLIIELCLLWPCVSLSPVNHQGRVIDGCDWYGSGLENSHTWNGVIPVYLRCQEGNIEWQYPRGALRIILRLGHSNKDFQGCIKVTENSSGANLYLEGHQQLHDLYKPRNSSIFENPRVCFQSVGGQVALFLDAQVGTSPLQKDIFSFLYDLQPIRDKSFSECRPCTERELIYHFCTSDFVVRGSISSIYQNEPLKRTELTVKSQNILRDSEPKVFSASNETHSNGIAYYGVFHRPLECGTKVGLGDFLFMGRWRLGDPILRCVPRWIEWKRVKRKAVFLEISDCLLQ